MNAHVELPYGECWHYDKPADKFWDGLPLGNGRMAAMIYGTPAEPKLSLCDETLWSGGPYKSAVAHDNAVKRIHEAINQGEYEKAQKIALELRGIPSIVQQYRSLGRMRMMTGHDRTTGYSRYLNFFSGLANICYDHEGHTFTQESFVSYPDQLAVLRMDCNEKNSLNISGYWETEQPVYNMECCGDGFIIEGGVNDAASSDNRAYEKVIPSILKWRLQIRIDAQGGVLSIRSEGNTVHWELKGADSFVMYLACATSYIDYNTVGFDITASCEAAMSKSTSGYEIIKQRHIQDLRTLMERFAIQLGDEKRAKLNTSSRISKMKEGLIDDMFIAQYTQYARYILLCGARTGTLAFNNHNIWAERPAVRWQGRWTLNINLQECYWIADVTGLPESYETLLTFTKQLAKSGHETARLIYEARGWCAHHGTDIWMNTSPQDYASWHSTYPMAGVWLCCQLADHYLYTQDDDFLSDLLPLMKGCVLFALDLLVEQDGYLVTCPSTSPENFFLSPSGSGKRVGVSIGSAHDMQLLRHLFTLFVNLAREEDEILKKEVNAALDRLPPHKIGRKGQLQEWFYDYEEAPEELKHRHISHLYACFPDNDISLVKNQQYIDSVLKTLELRGEDSLGWAGAWRACVYARLGMPEKAYSYLSRGVSSVSLHPSSNDSSITPSFEGNQAIQGWGAAVCELLLQSDGSTIHLLPSLPKRWKNGIVRGLRTRGGYIVNMEWNSGKLTNASVTSLLKSEICRITVANGKPIEYTCEKGVPLLF